MIGRRIKRMRLMRKITQKELGEAVGFAPENAKDRISQYESGRRTPKDELTNSIAKALNVSTAIIGKYDIATPEGLLCTLFELEDLYGVSLLEREGHFYFRLIKPTGADKLIARWYGKKKALFRGLITKDEYDNWKYRWSLEALRRDRN